MLKVELINSSNVADFEMLFRAQDRAALHSQEQGPGENHNLIAVGVRGFFNLPVGAALAVIDPAAKLAQVVYLLVIPPQRNHGAGSLLLEKIETTAREYGLTCLEISYEGGTDLQPVLENLIRKNGWAEGETEHYSYRVKTTTPENVERAKKKVSLRPSLPPDCEIFNWSALTESEIQEFKILLKTDPRLREAIDPFRSGEFEPINSLGLRHQGQVAGWQITHRESPDTIRYGNFFVRSDLRAAGGVQALIQEAVRLHFESGVAYFIWRVGAGNAAMQKFVENFIAPFSPVVTEHRVVRKEIGPLPSSTSSTNTDRDAKTPGLADYNPRTLAELLTRRAALQPDQKAFIFLEDGEQEKATLTYGELNRAAHRVASMLAEKGVRGERVALCIGPGLEYIAGFFGCLYAGALAVPLYPPELGRLKRTLPRLEAIIEDAQPKVALVDREILPVMQKLAADSPALAALELLAIDPMPELITAESAGQPVNGPENSGPVGNDTAFLMYTSGSTGQPKGVVVSHSNALHSIRAFPGFAARPAKTFVSWLPFFHDLGMFFGILQPVYQGVPAVLMPPFAFIQKPLRWLQAISHYKASTTGAPNFAYDLCTRKITPQERDTLDLSLWNMALNGAEPVRATTLQSFSEYFQSAGFSPRTHYPSYGLADATCSVSGGPGFELPKIKTLDRKAFENNLAVEVDLAETPDRPAIVKVVGCGQNQEGQQIVIANPDTFKVCAEGEVGEIWVRGPNIPTGYWNRPVESQQIFGATLNEEDRPEGETFMRTGDLGFMEDGELFITGRLKDAIIIRGRNLYPQDLELTAEKSHPALRPGCSVAFAIEKGGLEQVVLVCEVAKLPEGATDLQEYFAPVIQNIRTSLAEYHEINPYAISLIKPGSILKTSSGKLQRRSCRSLFLAGELEEVAGWRREIEQPGETFPVMSPLETQTALSENLSEKPDPAATRAEMAKLIADRLTAYFAYRLGVGANEIDPHRMFAYYGLVSVEAVSLVSELEELVGHNLPATLAWDYPTIDRLSRHLAGFNLESEAVPGFSRSQTRPGQNQNSLEPVAIVGLGCRYPGAANLAEFWKNLCNGVDSVTEIPPERWDKDTFFDPKVASPAHMITRWGGFLKDVDRFDPLFFGISPREAPQLDPRQRLMLEVAWEALEDAGIPPESLSGTMTGVFVANLIGDYGSLVFDDLGRVDAYSGQGTANSILANRLSYFLDLQGPSLAVDTACSGSLVAAHLACQSLRSGECETALVGGVNLILRPDSNIYFSKVEGLSPDGRCKVFDAEANGIVRSEGAGVAVLKTLRQAKADGDRIYGLILGSAVNSDGRSKGLMAPNRQAQEAVLRAAYRQAGVLPSQVQYVEAHGTGTPLGDPIEAQALGAVLKNGRNPGSYCALGSVKTNIGHTEAAAGMAGLIKVALSLKNRVIPPNLHFHKPNRLIPFENLPLVVQQKLGPWPEADLPLIAGVSSFGFGGTNAHLVLGEAGNEEELSETGLTSPAPAVRPRLLTINARTPEALQNVVRAYQQFLLDPDREGSLEDICYSAGVRHSHYNYRLGVTGQNRQEVAGKIQAYLEGKPAAGLFGGKVESPQNRKLVWVFSGQGSHWPGMGTNLMRQESVFRAFLTECDRLINEFTGQSLLEELAASEENSHLNSTEITQPAIFSIQVSLAALWLSWGIKPDVIVGQSLGEVAAAYTAGALSLRDAMRVVIERSRLMKTREKQGLTAVVELPLDQAQLAIASCDDLLGVAGSNSPTSSVLSGDPETLKRILNYLDRKKIFNRILPGVDVAFHSPQMDELQPLLVQALQDLKPRPTEVPLYSSVTGEIIQGSELGPVYWGRNLREPFIFSTVAAKLIENGFTNFLEVSPHPVLGPALNQHLRHQDRKGNVLASLKRGEDEAQSLVNSLAVFYGQGYNLNWPVLYWQPGKVVSLPTYQWHRERYWFDQVPGKGVRFDYRNGKTILNPLALSPEETILALAKPPQIGPFLDEALDLAFLPGSYLCSVEIGISRPAFLADHRVGNMVVLPGAAYVEIALEVCKQINSPVPLEIGQLEFKEMLILNPGKPKKVLTALQLGSDGGYTFKIYSLAGQKAGNESWTLHAEGNLCCVQAGKDSGPALFLAPDARPNFDGLAHISGIDHYKFMAQQGLNYGPAFQPVKDLWREDGKAFAFLQLPETAAEDPGNFSFHPVLLDGCLQAAATVFTVPQAGQKVLTRYLPAGLATLNLYQAPGPNLWCQVELNSEAGEETGYRTADINVWNDQGAPVARIEKLKLKEIKNVALVAPTASPHDDAQPEAGSNQDLQRWIYEIEWQIAKRPVNNGSDPQPGFRPGKWLIFAEDAGLSRSLIDLLEARGQKCLSVLPGTGFRVEKNQSRFYLNPARPDDFTQLFLELTEAEDDGTPDLAGVLFLWGISDQTGGNLKEYRLSIENSQDRGTIAALYLIQTLARQDWLNLPRLWLVTRGSQAVETSLDFNALLQTPLWGLGNVVANEHPRLRCSRLDLSTAGLPPEVEGLLDELALANIEKENQIVLRGDNRYVARLVRSGLAVRPDIASNFSPNSFLRPEAAYIVTGGAGGLGLMISKWLVSQGVKNLVLVGRSAPGEAALKEITLMQNGGTGVEYVMADVTSEEQVAAVLQNLKQPLKGIIFAAGRLDDALLVDQSREKFQTVMAPKVAGAWNFHRQTANLDLDFFVLFSSSASVLGQPGQGNYVAANTFMDSLARLRQDKHLPGLSLNWGPWTQVGMAAAVDRTELYASKGMNSIKPEQGLALLKAVLPVRDRAQLVLINANWPLMYDTFHLLNQSNYLAGLLTSQELSTSKVVQNRQSTALIFEAAPDKQLALLEAYLIQAIGSILNLTVEQLDPTIPLYNFGLDSLTAVEIKNRVETDLTVLISLAELLQGPAISDLCLQLQEQLAQKILSPGAILI